MRTLIKLSKNLLIRSGWPPLERVSYANGLLAFGNWLRRNDGGIQAEHRFELYEHVNEKVLANCAITYLEFGVATGNSIKKWAELNTHAESRFIGFDTFHGLPETWAWGGRSIPKGEFDVNGILPEIPDTRVRFVKGLFQETVFQFIDSTEIDNRLVVHLDADLYSSTLFVLTALHRLLAIGTVVMFDEFNVVNHEFRAWIDYTSAYNVEYNVLGFFDKDRGVAIRII